MILILILCHPTFSAKQKAAETSADRRIPSFVHSPTLVADHCRQSGLSPNGTQQIPRILEDSVFAICHLLFAMAGVFLLARGPTLQRSKRSPNRHPILTAA